jgi:hypothetical protein
VVAALHAVERGGLVVLGFPLLGGVLPVELGRSNSACLRCRWSSADVAGLPVPAGGAAVACCTGGAGRAAGSGRGPGSQLAPGPLLLYGSTPAGGSAALGRGLASVLAPVQGPSWNE